MFLILTPLKHLTVSLNVGGWFDAGDNAIRRYSCAGINESHLYQYRHLGDAVTKTDNIVGSGLDADDRWAFTNRSPSLNYSSASSLAAAARVLKGYNDEFAKECLALAQYIWKDEHTRKAEIVADQPF